MALRKSIASGTPDTNRTCDLPLRRGLLYPLSYRGAGRAFYRLVFAVLLSLSLPLFAQAPAWSWDDGTVPYVVTPMEIVERMLRTDCPGCNQNQNGDNARHWEGESLLELTPRLRRRSRAETGLRSPLPLEPNRSSPR